MKIEKLSHEGRGIAHYEDGKTLFIRNALPDETVRFEITHKHRQYDEAKAVEIVNPSPLRAQPKCVVFGRCGGCSLQHLDPAAQILAKQDWLQEKLIQARIEPQEWLPPLQAKIWGYRHKARLGVRFVKKKDTVLVGFREAESNFLTETDRCEVLHPSIGEHLAALKSVLTTLSIREAIPQIEVAVDDTHSALIIRHLAPFTDADLQKLQALHEQFGWVLFLQPKGLDSIRQIFPAEKIDLSYRVQDHLIHFVPGDFTQVNFSLNQLMVAQALDLLSPKADETILDLFCGLGNFTLPIAARAKQVIAVEGDAAMVQRAQSNAAAQGFSNITFHSADLFALKDKAPFYQPVDQVFLDPPRAGAQAVCQNIERWQPKRIVYVSCDPATLVRDLGILVHEKKYKLSKIGVMDMFPHTSHVESMALLESR